MTANIGGVQVPPGATVDIRIHIAPGKHHAVRRPPESGGVRPQRNQYPTARRHAGTERGRALCWSVPVVLTFSRPGASAVKSAKSSSMRLPASYWWMRISCEG